MMKITVYKGVNVFFVFRICVRDFYQDENENENEK